MSSPPSPPPPGAPAAGEFVLFQTEDAQTRVQVRLIEGVLWLTQRQMAELYEKDVRTVNEHLKNVYDDGELDPDATIRKFRIVAREGARDVRRLVDHYNLDAVLQVGYRVRSPRGAQFRQWATETLKGYLVKGFVLDDERFKLGQDADYFDELLARIRDIRSSEKMFWRKVLDIYATSVDYDPRAEASQRFFATVQNKMHWAAHGHTAAELIAQRADAAKPHAGLLTWAAASKGGAPRKADVSVAKNYLTEDELQVLNRVVNAYLEFAELQAQITEAVREKLPPIQAQLPMGESAAPELDLAAVVRRATELVVQQTIDIPRIAVVPKGEVGGGFRGSSRSSTSWGWSSRSTCRISWLRWPMRC